MLIRWLVEFIRFDYSITAAIQWMAAVIVLWICNFVNEDISAVEQQTQKYTSKTKP